MIVSLALMTGTGVAQQNPLGAFEELTDTKPRDGKEVWDKMPAPVQLEWGSTDVRYKKWNVPSGLSGTHSLRLTAWKGERVNAQAVLWTRKDLKNLRLSVGELKKGKDVIPASAVRTHFVRYVMTDEFYKDGQGGCGHREDKTLWDSSLVADMLDINKTLDVKALCAQPIWLNVWVPAETQAGVYRAKLTVSADGKRATLAIVNPSSKSILLNLREDSRIVRKVSVAGTSATAANSADGDEVSYVVTENAAFAAIEPLSVTLFVLEIG